MPPKKIVMDKSAILPHSPDDSKAKADLMALGIELDDALIERLQKNLGIERIFAVARRSANILKQRKGEDSAPEMLYRNVTIEPESSTASTMNPFMNNLMNTGNKASVSLLKELNDRESTVEPRLRPAVDKMIENFRHQYARAPERFVACMMGTKARSQSRGGPVGRQSAVEQATADHNISRIILKNRYVNEDKFRVMIHRIDKNVKDEFISALFTLLAENKSFASSTKRPIVDLWAFLTLLKEASGQSRRSYDGKRSQLATEVEFWHKENPSFSLADSSSFISHQSHVEDEKFMAENNRKFNAGSNDVRSSLSGGPSPLSILKAAGERRKPGSRFIVEPKQCVADRLGVSNLAVHSSPQHPSGRFVRQSIVSEFGRGNDVPTALNSPLKNEKPSPQRIRRIMSSFDGEPSRRAKSAGGYVALQRSDQISGVLNRPVLRPRVDSSVYAPPRSSADYETAAVLPEEGSGPLRYNIVHSLKREYTFDKPTSVAAALGSAMNESSHMYFRPVPRPKTTNALHDMFVKPNNPPPPPPAVTPAHSSSNVASSRVPPPPPRRDQRSYSVAAALKHDDAGTRDDVDRRRTGRPRGPF